MRTLRTCVAAIGVMTGFLSVPAESHAIFDWLRRCCGSTPAPTYAPAANACDCQPPQVTNYVPQTCYRTQYVTVPVTTYRPVTTCDPCTGCPVTCMRPTTTYVQQARLVPYTTFRMMVANFFGRSPCNTCGTSAVGYAPTAGYAASSGCSSCGTSAPAYASSTTTVPYASGSTVISSPANSVPTLPQGVQPPASSRETLKKPTTEEDGPLTPIPMKENDEPGSASQTGASSAPRRMTPADRTTSYPILRTRGYRPVSWDVPTAAPAQPTPPPTLPAASPKANRSRPIDDGGWRPSNR
ncbi:MAG TPA: hypothetical protein VFW87_15095 [Pirellulales bacterium]|nr:hypothetical protein [Pirellulales bacterium]